MGPDSKSNSFIFRKNAFNRNSQPRTSNCRKKLQDRFAECDVSKKSSSDQVNRSILSALSVDDTRKALRAGAERISKSLSSFRTTVWTFSQKFKISTRRCKILEEGPVTPGYITPRKILGRTPTKLYSPFGIESPYAPTTTTTQEHVRTKSSSVIKQ